MKTIYKYKLAPEKIQTIKMPFGAEILSVQVQGENICLWALVNPNVKDNDSFDIEIYGTGHSIAYDMGTARKHLGTVQLDGLVFHVFERFN